MSQLVVQLKTYDNAITNSFAIFTVGDSSSSNCDAVITASIATNSDITFTFSEAVRNLDDCFSNLKFNFKRYRCQPSIFYSYNQYRKNNYYN